MRQPSFKLRLVLAASLMVMSVIGVAFVLFLNQARDRITAERQSSVELTGRLVEDAIRDLDPKAPDPLERLAADLHSGVKRRHVHLFVAPLEQDKIESFMRQGSEGRDGLLEALLHSGLSVRSVPVERAGKTLGTVVMVATPEDELNEVSEDFAFVSILLLSLTTILIAVVWWSVSRAMRPLNLLRDGLGRLEQGDFSALLPPFSIPELQPIGDTFNHLAAALGQAQDENRQLIHKLLSIQETERAELARDFHDELGPCLFGIKTEAACIARNATSLSPEEAKARSSAIARLVEDLQHLNRRVLGKLRPVALAELGLRAALERLAADWRDRAPGVRWTFLCRSFEAEPSEPQAVALYRVAQEAMTNAARHSGARSVELSLECTGTQAALTVRDDGRGVPADARRGFGLLGIRERVQALGGRARIGNRAEGGTAVEVSIPLGDGTSGNDGKAGNNGKADK